MEPAKNLTIPCFSMKDSACIQTRTCLRSQRTRHGAASAASALCEFSVLALDGSPHAFIAPAPAFLSATGALPRGTGTQRNSLAPSLSTHDPIHPGRLVGLLNPVAALFRCVHTRRGGRPGAWSAAPSDGNPPAPDAAQLDGARPPRCHGATARF
jgi:hypothetical protein